TMAKIVMQELLSLFSENRGMSETTEQHQSTSGKPEEKPTKSRWKVLTNKYVISILVFVIWMGIFDPNNMIMQIKKRNELNMMLEKRKYYKEEIANNKQLIFNLENNINTVERYAREEFLMKREHEDIFLIIEDDTD
ncbi:MAG: hypothetical protein RQ866_05610, partial [Bacteroidales bacterium]|nr:hypothetical protein [Bacteroidales bacterium]